MRKVADSREFPSETKCTLALSGEPEEVVRATSDLAAPVHGHADDRETREQIRAGLQDEATELA
ncbi:DUF1059 domain-containing protein [Streptomyces sp. NBC_00316]|uniref:DUF1059 domain-containing protein n=1 Tax=Streptomyces sp. NBC_00316 TaxID=2975710 RepID=UPI002E28DE08|nr:DUF1059 domain-containing protein [Streptomyces sp. NBC_00316]